MSEKIHPIRSASKKGHTLRLLLAGICAVFIGGAMTTMASNGSHTRASFSEFGYVSGSSLLTINGASDEGVASGASRISARMFPAAFVDGPGGQTFANTDLFTSISAPDANGKSEYIINPRAKYSDGTAVTCNDFYLAWFAEKYKGVFNSDAPLLDQIQSFNCLPDDKKFSITFHSGDGAHYQELFNAGTVMPSHIVAKKAEISDIVGALDVANPQTVQTLAEAWSSSFQLEPQNVGNLVSAGPYMVKSVNSHDEYSEGKSVTLVANPSWWGDQPTVKTIVVYPFTADLTKLANRGALQVSDTDIAQSKEFDPSSISEANQASQAVNPESLEQSSSPESGTVPSSANPKAAASSAATLQTESAAPNAGTSTEPEANASQVPSSQGASASDSNTPNASGLESLGQTVVATPTVANHKYGIVSMLSRRIDSLIPAETGVMAQTNNRRAISQCVDRIAVADASGRTSGVTVPAYGLRITPPVSAQAAAVNDVAVEFAGRDEAAARKTLADQTIRLTYDKTNPRYAAMAKAIVDSCKDSGVTIQDVSRDHADTSALAKDADLYLGAVDPKFSFPSSNFVDGTIEQRRNAEKALWDTIPTIPLSGEPRTLVIADGVSNLVPSTSSVGLGWNMDRWKKDNQ